MKNFCKILECLCYLSVLSLHMFCITIVKENVCNILDYYSIHYLKQFGDFVAYGGNGKRGGRSMNNEITGKAFSIGLIYAFCDVLNPF